jgi:hypothetical protein
MLNKTTGRTGNGYWNEDRNIRPRKTEFGATLILMAAIVFKMAGAWPVGPSDREALDRLIEEHPYLNDSLYQKLRFDGAYFSEQRMDWILYYWSERLKAKQSRSGSQIHPQPEVHGADSRD